MHPNTSVTLVNERRYKFHTTIVVTQIRREWYFFSAYLRRWHVLPR